jgi:hypothetical protein
MLSDHALASFSYLAKASLLSPSNYLILEVKAPLSVSFVTPSRFLPYRHFSDKQQPTIIPSKSTSKNEKSSNKSAFSDFDAPSIYTF